MFKKFVFGICVPSAEIGSASAYAISNFWRAEYRKDQVQGIWFGRTSDSSPCVEGLLCQGPTFVFILWFCFSSWLLHNVFFSCGCDVWRSQHFSILYFFSSFLKLTSTGSCVSSLAINVLVDVIIRGIGICWTLLLVPLARRVVYYQICIKLVSGA